MTARAIAASRAETLKQLTAEAADRLTLGYLARQPVATALVLSCVQSLLDDEQALIEIVRRELRAEPAMQQAIRELIRIEAEQVAEMELAYIERVQ
jgi:hypothetical protein